MALHEELEQQGNWLFKYRGVLPVLILVAGICVHVHTELNPDTFFLEDTPYEIYYEIGCLLVSLFGLFIRVYTVGYTPAGTSGRNTGQGQVAERLNTTGIYSVVRHPLYVGNFFMWFGISLVTGNPWFIVAFCLFYCLYYERIMYAEEQFLGRKFGEEYARWAGRTPAFFPNFKLFVKPDLPYSWKKVLRMEKNGLLALCLVFFLLNVVGEWVETGEDHYNTFFLAACLSSIMAYAVLKYLKSRTRVLNEPNR
jgi:protein-S-isoprenylcysteine O-methyltransferase Ste14